MTHNEKVSNITKTLRYLFKYTKYISIKSFKIEHNSEKGTYIVLNPSVPFESKNLTEIARFLIKKIER